MGRGSIIRRYNEKLYSNLILKDKEKFIEIYNLLKIIQENKRESDLSKTHSY